MDAIRFSESCDKIIKNGSTTNGFGTLSEKTMHAVLKDYFQPFSDSQEIKVGNYIADIVGENGIIEIQTKRLANLAHKLDAFLPCCRVCVVHPLIACKKIIKVDKNDGLVISKRKSPIKKRPIDIFDELYSLRNYILDPNFSLCICLIEADEIRTNETRRHKIKKVDTLPSALIAEIHLNSPDDYRQFIPTNLPEQFTSAEFAKAAHTSNNTARSCLNTLSAINLVERVGKRGNSILFTVG